MCGPDWSRACGMEQLCLAIYLEMAAVGKYWRTRRCAASFSARCWDCRRPALREPGNAWMTGSLRETPLPPAVPVSALILPIAFAPRSFSLLQPAEFRL